MKVYHVTYEQNNGYGAYTVVEEDVVAASVQDIVREFEQHRHRLRSVNERFAVRVIR